MILTYTPLGVTFRATGTGSTSAPIRLQPSEFAKLALVVWGADVLARKQKLLDQPKHLLVPYLPVAALIILLIIFQGDAGTAVVIGHRGRGAVDGRSTDAGAGGLAAAGAVGVAALILTCPIRLSRFEAFLNPTLDIEGINRQASFGMYAIASGGWWGVGLGASRQKWGTLPEAHSDFIFAVIGEEFGLVRQPGGADHVRRSGLRRDPDRPPLRRHVLPVRRRRGDRLAHRAGLINLAVVLRLLPIAGVPLPLVSYGGSALLATSLPAGCCWCAPGTSPRPAGCWPVGQEAGRRG